ncbi:hypothetical protein M7I_4415 [Glarea lozoyensis 74030]|uniref:Uncharacterized protein n=1 Tax=Glarea lozoyensis (strain ATCC 74030 / MF5533) TaxID=1104152 RepID=H0EP46_GLAL7|nr:hypothetical protein M7I_4415 [Glarea lozoyensis 74030]
MLLMMHQYLQSKSHSLFNIKYPVFSLIHIGSVATPTTPNSKSCSFPSSNTSVPGKNHFRLRRTTISWSRNPTIVLHATGFPSFWPRKNALGHGHTNE